MPDASHRLLVERDAELELVEAMLRRAAQGDGSTLLLDGEAGIGKSSLLAEARRMAHDRDARVLWARGSPVEREFAFGIVRQLLEPAVRLGGDELGSDDFDGAASFAQPIFTSEGAREADLSGDRGFAVLHGLYWLTLNVAQDGAHVLVVDDVHWCDPPSLRFLTFLARRLDDLPVAMMLARRSGEPGIDLSDLTELFADSRITVLRPRPLSPDAVRQLIEHHTGESPDDEFVAGCHHATGGNPFLLENLLQEAVDERLSPNAAHVLRLGRLRPLPVADAVLGRLARLGDAATAIARATAVLGDAARLAQAAAVAGLTEAEAAAAAEELMAAMLLKRGARLTFLHPLVREAIYHDLSPRQRSSLHRRAADLLTASGAPPDKVAAHLLLTDPADDEPTVEVLRNAAAVARKRGAPDAAAAYLRRALEERPAAHARAPLLLQLGVAERDAGDARAIEHLERAYELADPVQRGSVAAELAVALVTSGRPGDAVNLLVDTIPLIEADDREAALGLEAQLAAAAQLDDRSTGLLFERLGRLAPELSGNTAGERQVLANLCLHVSFTGGQRGQARPIADRALGGGRLLAEQTSDAPVYWYAVTIVMHAEPFGEAVPLLDAALEDARRRGSALGYAIWANFNCALSYVRGAVADAEAEAREALDRAIHAGWLAGVPLIAGTLTFALLERGEVDAAAALLVDHDLDGPLPPQLLFDQLLSARAELRLAEKRFDDALQDLEEMARRQERRRMTCAWYAYEWRPAAARALAGLGRAEEGAAATSEAVANARSWGAPRPLVIALRTRALFESGQARVALLREAADIGARSEAQVVQAHTLVQLGQALRLAREPSEARPPLRAALEVAEASGAPRLAESARAELAATGETRARGPGRGGGDALTPQERRVSEMAAEGMTNREIAQALFVTPKTVEVHLSNAYRKLGIRSRAELAERADRTRGDTADDVARERRGHRGLRG